MPKPSPGLPYGSMLKLPPKVWKGSFKPITTVSSHASIVHEWKFADKPERQERWGGPDKCCFDAPAKQIHGTAKECCAIQKYRQVFHPTIAGYGFWAGVRSLQILTGKSFSNVGFIVQRGGGEHLTADSGFAAAPGGSSNLAVSVREGLTVEAWVRSDGIPGQPKSGFVSTLVDADPADAEASEYGFFLGLGEEGAPEFTVATKDEKRSKSVRANAARLEADEWVHLAGTYDGSSIKIYVNGKREGEAKVSGSINFHPDGPLLLMRRTMIGRMADQPTTVGSIDEVRIWRRPLTACQIGALLDVQQSEPLHRDLIVYYRMDGQAAPDVKEICSEVGGYRAFMVGDAHWLDSDVPVKLGPATNVCRTDAGTGLRADTSVPALAQGNEDFYHDSQLGCPVIHWTPALDNVRTP